MITVYDSKTGEPVELDGVDARERIDAGLALANRPEPEAKEDSQPAQKRGK